MDNKTSASYRRVVKSAGGMDRLYGLVKVAINLRKQGVKILDCGLGESSHGLSTDIIRAGESALNNAEYNYTKPLHGLISLRNVLSKSLIVEFKHEIDPENIIVTCGAEMGLDLVFKTFIDSSDEVVLFDPFFIPFYSFVRSYGGKVVIVDTYNSDFLPDIDQLKDKATQRTKMIVVNYPNNPTGRIPHLDFIKAIAQFAKERGILLLSDETYKFFDFNGQFVSPYVYYPEGTIVVRSFSKEYSMMGYKVGYLVCSEELATFVKQMQLPGWSAPRISSLMADAALKTPPDSSVLAGYKAKRDFLYEQLNKLGVANYLPEGSFYFYLASPFESGSEFAHKLANQGLLVTPAFSIKDTHVRLSYGALSNDNLEQVVEVIKQTVTK